MQENITFYYGALIRLHVLFNYWSLAPLTIIGCIEIRFHFSLRTQELSPSKMKKLCEEVDSLDRLMEETERFVCQQKEQLKHLKVSGNIFVYMNDCFWRSWINYCVRTNIIKEREINYYIIFKKKLIVTLMIFCFYKASSLCTYQ